MTIVLGKEETISGLQCFTVTDLVNLNDKNKLDLYVDGYFDKTVCSSSIDFTDYKLNSSETLNLVCNNRTFQRAKI